MCHSDQLKLKETIRAEYDFFIKNETWELITTPKNQQIVTSSEYFKLKKDYNSNIFKYKARQIAHDFKQKEGIDFVEIFVAIVKRISLKYLFGIGIKRGYRIQQMDIVTAFLYGFLDKIIYIKQSYLFEFDAKLICHLYRVLCGLKQVPQVWY